MLSISSPQEILEQSKEQSQNVSLSPSSPFQKHQLPSYKETTPLSNSKNFRMRTLSPQTNKDKIETMFAKMELNAKNFPSKANIFKNDNSTNRIHCFSPQHSHSPIVNYYAGISPMNALLAYYSPQSDVGKFNGSPSMSNNNNSGYAGMNGNGGIGYQNFNFSPSAIFNTNVNNGSGKIDTPLVSKTLQEKIEGKKDECDNVNNNNKDDIIDVNAEDGNCCGNDGDDNQELYMLSFNSDDANDLEEDDNEEEDDDNDNERDGDNDNDNEDRKKGGNNGKNDNGLIGDGIMDVMATNFLSSGINNSKIAQMQSNTKKTNDNNNNNNNNNNNCNQLSSNNSNNQPSTDSKDNNNNSDDLNINKQQQGTSSSSISNTKTSSLNVSSTNNISNNPIIPENNPPPSQLFPSFYPSSNPPPYINPYYYPINNQFYQSHIPFTTQPPTLQPSSSKIPATINASNLITTTTATNKKIKRIDPQTYLNESYEYLSHNIFPLAKDQAGCRFLQKKLDDDTQTAVNYFYPALIPYIHPLVRDPFGNYLIQKLCDFLSHEQLIHIINILSPNILDIGANSHGTRVIQHIISYLKTDDLIKYFFRIITPYVIPLLKELNGTHIIQKLLTDHPTYAHIIHQIVVDNCENLATHRHGCCVLQKYLESNDIVLRKKLVNGLIEHCVNLIVDQFGNYVIQSVLLLNDVKWNNSIAEKLVERAEFYSKHKYSSNVVEKCFDYCDDSARKQLIQAIGKAEIIAELIVDEHGNYVVQRALACADAEKQDEILGFIVPCVSKIKSLSFGERVISKLISTYPQLGKMLNTSRKVNKGRHNGYNNNNNNSNKKKQPNNNNNNTNSDTPSKQSGSKHSTNKKK